MEEDGDCTTSGTPPYEPGAGVQSSASEAADLRAALTVLSTSAAEDMKAERQKYLDEVANLHQLLEESQQESRSSSAALRDERAQWSLARATLTKEIESLQSSNPPELESRLEQSREEVAKLKWKLERAVEAAGPQAVTLAALLGVDDVNEANDESMKELERMDFERCQVTDLRMYMMALVTQKRLLQEDNHKLALKLEEAELGNPPSEPTSAPQSPGSMNPMPFSPLQQGIRSDSMADSEFPLPPQSGRCTSDDSDRSLPAVSDSPATSQLAGRSSRSRIRSTSTGALDFAKIRQDLPVGDSPRLSMSSADLLGEVSPLELDELRELAADQRMKLTCLTTQLKESRTLCENYELQLQQAQGQSQLLERKQKDLEHQLDKCMAELTNERDRSNRLEGTSRRMAEDFQVTLSSFADEQARLEAMKFKLVESFSAMQEECRQQMDYVIEAKDKVALQLAELEVDYTDLRSSTAARIETLSKQLSDQTALRRKGEDCLSSLNKEFQRQYTVAEDNRSELSRQLEDTSDRLRSEQLAKHESEQQLKLDIVRAQGERDDTKVALAAEARSLEQARARVKDVEHQLGNLQGRSKEIIVALQQQLEQEKSASAGVDERNKIMRGQLENMREQLDSSQLVQQDFVRLSQNLQVQLANMVDKQRQMRWEHEDDVDTCRGCDKVFSVTKRKHHCRQCGKIFCSDCSNKTVPGGQSQRPMRVCDDCHTLITTDTPMQFAMDPSAAVKDTRPQQ